MAKTEDGDEEITHSRTCEECGRETYKFERCHHCGDVHWNIVTDGGEERSEVDRVEFDAEYPSLDAMEDAVLEYGYAMTARCVRIGDWIIQPSPTDDDCVQLAHVDFKGNVERESRGYL